MDGMETTNGKAGLVLGLVVIVVEEVRGRRNG